MIKTETLPTIIAGPMLRHCDRDHFTLWFVSTTQLDSMTLSLTQEQQSQRYPINDSNCHCVPLGEHAFQYLIHLCFTTPLRTDVVTDYQITTNCTDNLFGTLSQLTYQESEQEVNPHFVVKSKIDHLLHGSCRNPHHHSGDALVAADTELASTQSVSERPALLMLSGDQVYVDDIAGPMLYAISQISQLLGLHGEQFIDAPIQHSHDINYDASRLYQRHQTLLPRTQYPAKTSLWHWYINHPIFTSSLAENHLVSLNEIIALYLLVWSPELWLLIDIPYEMPELSPKNKKRWQQQWQHLLEFKAGLGQVRRLLAHLPTYMIFDDHDVTDDWNLTAKWEQAAYQHPFSKRIIGNALIGYTLFQGLGNAPEKFSHQVTPAIDAFFKSPSAEGQDALIEILLQFDQWHYSLNSHPKLIVVDTRTRRWRSESNLAKPSGLLDWEALTDLQQELLGHEQVIIVSPAPMFGVKVIETIQRTATLLGGSLLVDAENWMAHPGAANTLLSIFMHKKTPQQFIILSGDVHYSFAYDIRLRFRRGGPNIYQICCSGIKNQFPEKLLPIFDRLNGWLYGRFSPLNLLTKRKRLSIKGRRPNGATSRRLVNKSGIGKICLTADGVPSVIEVLHADMAKTEFAVPRQHRHSK